MERRRNYVEDEEKNTKQKGNVFFKIIAGIFIVVTCIFLASIFKFNMLPTSYLMILTVALFVFTTVSVLFLVGKRISRVVKIILSVVLLVVMAIYVYGINYIIATMSFMDSMTTEIEETEDYYVITLKNNKYNALNALNGEKIYVFAANEDYTDIKDAILAKTDVTFEEVSSIKELQTKLIEGKVNAILISNSQYDMLYDEDKAFADGTRQIFTITHKIKSLEKEDNENLSDDVEIPKYTIESGAFNIYISGIDTNGRISNVARSDANIILTVNTDTHTILLTSIPRDYYVTLHSKKSKDKLTHSGIYGIQETYMTVEDLLGIDINYYVRVNFTTLEKIVNALGGIEVYSEYAFKSYVYSYKKGINYLNGAQALEFARERYAFASGDRQRIKNQQAVLKGIMDKILTSETILTKYTALLSSLSNSFQTNISTDEINTIVKGQLNNMYGWTIETNSLDGTGANLPTYSYGSELLYVMQPNEASVSNAIKKINSILNVDL